MPQRAATRYEFPVRTLYLSFTSGGDLPHIIYGLNGCCEHNFLEKVLEVAIFALGDQELAQF